MWETIKKEPLLKAVITLILGVFAFGLAFNIMFGSNNRMMDNGMMDNGMMGNEMGRTGYSLSQTLGYTLNSILMISIQLLFIILVVTGIVITYRFAKQYITQREEIKIPEAFKKDPVIKGAIIVLGLILFLALIFFSTGSIFSGAFILIALLKVILWISVIGVIVGLGMYFYSNSSIQQNSKNILSKLIVQKEKEVCSNCGSELKTEWQCCPYCGDSKKDNKEGAE